MLPEFHTSDITINPLWFLFHLVLNFNLPKYFHPGCASSRQRRNWDFPSWLSQEKGQSGRFCCLLCCPVSPICSFLSPALRDENVHIYSQSWSWYIKKKKILFCYQIWWKFLFTFYVEKIFLVYFGGRATILKIKKPAHFIFYTQQQPNGNNLEF